MGRKPKVTSKKSTEKETATKVGTTTRPNFPTATDRSAVKLKETPKPPMRSTPTGQPTTTARGTTVRREDERKVKSEREDERQRTSSGEKKPAQGKGDERKVEKKKEDKKERKEGQAEDKKEAKGVQKKEEKWHEKTDDPSTEEKRRSKQRKCAAMRTKSRCGWNDSSHCQWMDEKCQYSPGVTAHLPEKTRGGKAITGKSSGVSSNQDHGAGGLFLLLLVILNRIFRKLNVMD